MKRVLTKFLAISGIALLMLASCKKDENKAVATGGKPGALQASATTVVLDKTDLTSTAVTFNWTASDFGYKAAVTNVLQIDVTGDNFATPKEYPMGAKALVQAFTTMDFNALLLKLNLPTGVPSQVQARIKSSINATTTPVYSNVLGLTVTPFSLVSYVYVPGAYQGWHPETADSLESPVSNGVYNGIINFTGADLNFKVNSNRDWNHTNYGLLNGAFSSAGNAGNFLAPADGGILITFDLNNSTIVYTPQWSIIGDATPGGWGSDTNMLYDKVHDTWYITAKLVSDGGQAVKFRFKNDWTINLGGSGGTLTQNGANITVPNTGAAGAMYAITLNANNNTYTLVKQ